MQKFVKTVLAFFAASDGIVNLNLARRFKDDVPMLEAGYFYDQQISMENIHAFTYSLQIDTIIPDRKERQDLLNAIQTMAIIKKIANFMFKCIESTAKFAERLLRMACVEGILFTGCFCVIYWLASRGLMPGLGHANELIARDEALHTMFAMFLYSMMKQDAKLSIEEVYAIIREAVELASEFIHEALPKGLPEMNAELMIEYIKSQADNLITLINVPPLYNAKHDFHFMDQINQTNRTNFFERHVSEYAKVGKSEKSEYEIAENF
jgi:ribonucleotide reductase beta subunit family protein with ferritin-like domain